jgi:hypothetical protein
MTENGSVRRDQRERLRRVARQRATAFVLERRAGRSANAVLAGLLRERAGLHRRVAERLEAGLPVAG